MGFHQEFIGISNGFQGLHVNFKGFVKFAEFFGEFYLS